MLQKLQIDVIEIQQYSPKNNIEIYGLPETDDESVEELEKKVIKIAKAVDVKNNHNDIKACHRFKLRRNEQGPRKLIVRFVSRKVS